MVVHEDRMRANLELTSGALFSQRVLLTLVSHPTHPMQRDDAYRIVQRLAQQAWDTGTPLRDLLAAEPGVDIDLDAVFDYGHYLRHVPEVMQRLDSIPRGDGPAVLASGLCPPCWRAARSGSSTSPGMTC